MKSKEVIFLLILNAIVFLFYSYDRQVEGIEAYRIAYFINYLLAASIINYFALPYFYKNRKIVQFTTIVIVCLISAVLIEELVLEQIFFPERGSLRAFWALIEIIPIIAILTGAKFAWDALNKQREVDSLKDAVKQSELQYLKSQINPHFLFNNLNNLYSYALEGSEKTPEIILELSGLLRYMLYECQDEYVSLRKEVDHLENFINLNQLQIENRGSVDFKKDDIINSHQIAPLILVVFVENAFKHSQSSLSEGIDIKAKIAVDKDGILKFSCENNYDESSNNDSISKGIGLANVKKRLELIYPKNHILKIEKLNNQFRVDLEIKLS